MTTTQHTGGQLSFGHRLRAAMDAHGKLCVGIDPHPELLTQWGLDDSATALERFSMTVIEAVSDSAHRVAALKPQVALYERHGSAGLRVLEKVLAASAEAEILTIADAKRGDIGSTMAGYADAWLRDGSALAADSVTLSPYLGYESLRPAIDLAVSNGRGVFVLGLTSNPEGASVQHVGGPGGSVAGTIVSQAGHDNLQYMDDPTDTSLGPVGLVIGATVADQAHRLRIDLASSHAALLAPGFGSQGATVEQMQKGFGAAWNQVLVNSSRAILAAGPSIISLRSIIDETIRHLSGNEARNVT